MLDSSASAHCAEHSYHVSMDKPQPAGQNQGRVFNFRSVCVHAMQLRCSETELTNLKLKTRSKQLLGSLLLSIALPAMAQ
jgi:hypothetical protein